MDGADGMPMGAANSTLNMSHMDNSASGLNQVPTVDEGLTTFHFCVTILCIVKVVKARWSRLY